MPRRCFKHIINIFFACLSLVTHGQNPELFLTIGGSGNEACQGLVSDSEGNLYISGSFEGSLELDSQTIIAEGDDLFFLKVNPDQEIQWIKSIGSPLNDAIVNMVIDSNDNLVASGFYWQQITFEDSTLTTTKNPKAYFLIQYDTNGNLNWAANIVGSNLKEVTDAAVSDDNQIYLSGYFQDTLFIGDTLLIAKGNTDAFIAKYNPDGQFLWALQEGFQGDTRGLALATTSDGGVAIAGYFNDTTRIAGNSFTANTSDWDVFISAYRQDGLPLWSKKAGGVFEEEVTGMAIDQEGNIFITGFLVGVMKISEELSIQSSNGNADFFLLKYDSEGNPLAARAYGGSLYQQTTGIDIHNESLILTGYYQGSMAFDQIQVTASGDFDGFVASVSSNLSINWFKDFSSGSFVLPSKMAKVPLGFMIGGSYRATLSINQSLFPAQGNFDVFLLSFITLPTSVGTVSSQKNLKVYPNPTTDWLYLDAALKDYDVVLLDANGKIVFKGQNVRKIKVQSLPSGIYTLRLDNENVHLSRKVFVKK